MDSGHIHKTRNYNFKAEAFPLKIEAFRVDNNELVWTRTVDRPKGDALSEIAIPPLAQIHGCKVNIRVTFGDGRVFNSTPDKEGD